MQLNSLYHSVSYIGDEQLPLGDNPFYTPPPTPIQQSKAVIWIVALCAVIIILAAFLGWAVYKWRVTSKQQQVSD